MRPATRKPPRLITVDTGENWTIFLDTDGTLYIKQYDTWGGTGSRTLSPLTKLLYHRKIRTALKQTQ